MFKIPRKYRRIIVAVTIIAAIFLISAQYFFFKAHDAGFRAGLLRNYPALTKILPLYRQIRKLSDITYLPYFFRINNLPAYELVIGQKSRQEMDDSLPEGFMNVTYTNKVWVPAEFKYDGKTYQVKVRYRGDNAVHWNAPKKSYLIRFDQDNLFNGIRELSFIIADDRLFALEHLNNYRAKKLGLFYPASSFGNLHINGRNNGLYFIIEGWSQELLAKWEIPDDANFYDTADPDEDNPIPRNYILWDNLERWGQDLSDQQFNYEHFSEVNQLLILLNESSDQEFFNSIFNLVDKDNFYNWQIHQELIHSKHQVSDNVRLFFNSDNGKFYFVPWDLGNSAPAENLNLYSRLAQRIFSNPVYLHEKNKRLYQYAADENNFKDDLNFYDQTIKEIKIALYQDRMKIYTNRWADNLIAQRRQHMVDAIAKVKNRFKNSLIFVDVGIIDDDGQKFQAENILAYFDFNIKSESDLYFKDFKLEANDGFQLADYRLYYDANFNDTLDQADKLITDYQDVFLYSRRIFNPLMAEEAQLTKHRFYLTSAAVTSTDFSDNFIDVKLEMENAITGEKIKNKEITSIKIINDAVFKNFPAINDVDKFERENPIFRVNRQTREIILPVGSYLFDKTVIVPKRLTLKISPGTNLWLAPGVSIVSYSNVLAQGTAFSPINIVGQDSKNPWGTFAILNSDQESRFNYVHFAGGKDDYINGVYFSGMLSVYYSDVVVENSEFNNAWADDALNVKSARAVVINSIFANNSADAIDFDFIKEGRITSNKFSNNGNDGVDLSGTTILIADNNISGSGDKCISVGEKSLGTIVYNNVLNSCDVGAEIKDSSDIKIINNVIINNRIGLNAYVKKPVFGGGKAEVYNSIIWDNGTDIQTDEQSEILVYRSDLKDNNQNNNFSLQPVFNADFTIKKENANILFINGGDSEILEEVLDLNLETAPVGLNR